MNGDRMEVNGAKWWESIAAASEAFDFDGMAECPLLRGEIGHLIKRSISQESLRVAVEIVKVLMTMPPENLTAFVMHVDGASDRAIGRAIQRDNKTAKSRYEEVIAALQESSLRSHMCEKSSCSSGP